MTDEYQSTKVRTAMDEFVREKHPGVLEADSKISPVLMAHQIGEDNIRNCEANAKFHEKRMFKDVATAMGKKGFVAKLPWREALKAWWWNLPLWNLRRAIKAFWSAFNS